MNTLRGKVAVVTGSSRGIGKATALALATGGAKVVVAARTESEKRIAGSIYQTAKEIEGLGGKALPIRVDLSKDEDIQGLFERIRETWGRLDVLINNAGINPVGPAMQCQDWVWERVFAVNVRAPFRCSQLAVPLMRQNGGGHILNVSSFLAKEPAPGMIPYCATKAALDVLTLGLAVELREYKVAVNAVAPSYTDTEGLRYLLSEADRSAWQRPEDWAKYSVAIVCRDPSTFSGQILSLEDCIRLFPEV